MTDVEADDNRTIVLVEDDPDLIRLLRFLLERDGFAVESHADAETALAAVGREPPPVAVILDQMIPMGRGLDVLGAIRKSSVWATVPVLILSSRDRDDDITEGLHAGADDYLTKPFQPRELLARLRKAIH
jgi:DNA-binding response OmpR family regulator